MKKLLADAAKKLDFLDVCLVLGLGMLWLGLSETSTGLAWAACGSVLLVFCLVGAVAAALRRPPE